MPILYLIPLWNGINCFFRDRSSSKKGPFFEAEFSGSRSAIRSLDVAYVILPFDGLLGVPVSGAGIMLKALSRKYGHSRN